MSDSETKPSGGSVKRLKSWFAPPDRLVQVARITSGVVMLAGCLVLIGWKLDLAILKSVIPGAATMKANTAVCFLLAGILLSLQTSKRTRLATQIANGCAIAVSTIGLLTLSQFMFGWHLGIDELLVRDPAATIASAPGRMGINTAFNFSSIGIALWLANRQEPQPQQRQHRVKLDQIAISQSLATVAGFVALQAVVGYAYNVQVFYQPSIFATAMALQTAIVFMVLCGGILALSSDRGWIRSFTSDLIGGDVARRFVPIAIVAPLVVGWLILRGHQANFYDTNFAFSLMSISLVAISLGLIGLNAGILDRVDYDRIRSDDRIRSSEERLQLALEGANQGIWCLDLQTKVLTWDDRCKAIFGLSPDVPLTYAQRLDMLHPDDRQRVADALTIAAREGGEFVQEYRTIYPNGKICWVLSQGRSYCDAAGRPTQMSGTMMDITDRKQAEAALRESNRKFSAVLDQTFELVGLVSVAGVVLEVNQTALASVAACKSEIVGKWLWETPWWQTDQLQQQVKDAIVTAASGQLVRYEMQFISVNGVLTTLDFSLKPVFDDRDRVMMLVAEGNDITAQQAAMRETQQAQAELQRRNQELEAFGYIVAHDLKAPLRAISNLSQWIEDDLEGVLTADTQSQMTLLRSRVRRMGSTIDGLLDYARIGATDAKIEPVSVAQLLAETIDSIDPPPTFTITIAPDLPTLNTKWLSLFQVFTNLISNAIKHHHRADGSLHIFGRDLGDLYEFAVSDDGPGIAPEQHARMFEIFQAMNPQNRSDSTGIGLSIVKKIIETEGGTIRLESQLGAGTTFYFTWLQ